MHTRYVDFAYDNGSSLFFTFAQTEVDLNRPLRKLLVIVKSPKQCRTWFIHRKHPEFDSCLCLTP